MRNRPPLPTLPPDDVHDPHRLTRRNFILGTTAAGLSLAIYAASQGRHELEIIRRSISIAKLPTAFQNFRIVQLSDIHLVEYTEPWFLARAVDRINALAPDLLLITGDFISRGPLSPAYSMRCMHTCAEVLSGLKVPETYAVLGNHDAKVDAKRIVEALQAIRIPTLVDTFLKIERSAGNTSAHLWLAGAKDPGVLGCDLNAALPVAPDAPVIFMAHEPDFADVVRRHPRFAGVDLMLSGHTHGGQIRLPLVGPLILPALGKHYVHGLYRLNHMQLYVNRGLGTVEVPFRLNCPPEITELTLTRG